MTALTHTPFRYPLALPAGLDIGTVMEAVERQMTSLDDPGFCLACGAEADGCEPDAEGYACETCGAPAVCGAESVFLRYGA